MKEQRGDVMSQWKTDLIVQGEIPRNQILSRQFQNKNHWTVKLKS